MKNYGVIEDFAELERIVLEEIHHAPTRVDGLRRAGIWEQCWQGQLERFMASAIENAEAALVPEFLARLPAPYIMLVGGRFVEAYQPELLCEMQAMWRTELAARFLGHADSIYEFGCGSGFNLVALKRQFMDVRMIGLDLAPACGEIIEAIRARLSITIQWQQFDLKRPELFADEVRLDSRSAVLTMGALEQVGKDWGPFLEFLLARRPLICLHVEPLLELYDESLLLDFLAARYHRARGYLEGFLPALLSDPRVEVVAKGRAAFGNRHNEGFSFVAWRPR